MKVSPFLATLILAGVVVGLWQGWEFWDRQFKLTNIVTQTIFEDLFTHSSQQEIAEVKALCEYPFHYLSQGNQTYVFESADRLTVLKFFKLKRAQNKDNHSQSWADKKSARNFIGYRLANERDKENCALIYTHLTPTDFLKQKVDLVDRFGLHHSVDLDQTIFVLQHKGDLLRTTLAKLLEEKKVATAIERISQLLEMYVRMYQNGVYDRDHNVMINTGFIGSKPFRLDLGKLRADEQVKNANHFQKDLVKVAKRIDRWVGKSYPQYQEEVQRAMNEKIAQLINNPPLAFLK